jgi:hypothetical protein
MHPVLKDLLHLLKLERIEDNIFSVGRFSVRHYRQRTTPLKDGVRIPCTRIFSVVAI